MELDLIIMTFYGIIYGMYLVILTYKKGHEFHHWMFGAITMIAVIPVIITYLFTYYDYYLTIILIGFIIGLTSFIMDYKDFKIWLKKRKS